MHQHEIVEPDREVERRQPRHRDRDQDRNFDERPVVAHPLDRLVGPADVIAGVYDHHRRRLLGDRLQVEPSEVEPAERHAAPQLA